MRIIRRRSGSIAELVASAKISKESDLAAPIDERLKKGATGDLLEKLYRIDGITFREVNDYIDFLVGAGFYFEGNPDLCKEAEEWSEAVGLKQVLEEVVMDILVGGAGNAFVELGYSKDGKDILALRVINPKYMDYIRDPVTKNVELASDLKPVGFIYRSPDTTIEWRRESIIKNGKVIWRAKTSRDDGRDRIAHFKLFSIGGSFLGITPLEAVYKQALIRLNLEDSVGEGAFRSGSIVAYVGSPDTPRPSREIIDSIVNDLKNVSTESIFGFPYDVKLERMPAPDLNGKEQLILYFAAVQSIGMGIPISRHILPSSRLAIRATESADIDFERRISSLQDRLARAVREKLLFRLFYARRRVTKLSEVPNIVFRTKSHTVLRETINMLSRLGRRDLVRRDPELEKKVREELGLPTSFIDRELELWKADKSRVPEHSKSKSDIEVDEDTVRELQELIVG